MAESQQKPPAPDEGWNLGDRLAAALGRKAVNGGYPFSSWTLPFEDLKALLDTIDQAQQGRRDLDRLEALEKAARYAVWCWFSDGLRPVRCAMLRLLELVGPVDEKDIDFDDPGNGVGPLPDSEGSGDQPTRDYWKGARSGGESRGSDPVDLDVRPADPASDPMSRALAHRLTAIETSVRRAEDRLARLEAGDGQ